MGRRKKNLIFSGLFLIIIFLNSCSLLPCYILDGFSGKIIDADTKEPIVGASVLVVYNKFSPSIAGGSWHPVDGRETLSDENGEFKIEKSTTWFSEKRGHPRGYLEIFKPGHGNIFHPRFRAIGTNKSWPAPNTYFIYEMPELKTIEERIENLPYRPRLPAEIWPELLKLLNQERRVIGYPLLYPKKDVLP